MLFKTLKGRLAFWFLLLFTITAISTISLSISYFLQRDKITDFSHSINKAQILISQKFRLEQDIVYNEYKRNSFYTNDLICQRLNKLGSKIKTNLSNAESNGFSRTFKLHKRIKSISDEFMSSENTFSEIFKLVRKRGHNDWGLIGKMRSYAHQLEESEHVPTQYLLQLRRHEKDYILRNEDKDIRDFYKYSRIIISTIENQYTINDSVLKSIKTKVDNYLACFSELVGINNQLGNDDTGLIKKMYDAIDCIDVKFERLQNLLEIKEAKQYAELKITILLIAIILLFVSIGISLLVSNRITRPLSKLTRIANEFVNSNFSLDYAINIRSRYNEVNQLSNNFEILRKELKSYINDFQVKLKQGTAEITYQKERIELQNEEIKAQRDDLSRKNDFIINQKQLLEKQNKNVFDSINYAKHIQDSFLPAESKVNKLLGQSFVFYRPKDIVSGDFYYIENIKYKKEDLALIAVADCTGHGVPGAFMSLIGHNLLRRAIKEKKVTKPSEVLDFMDKHLYKTLQSPEKNNEISDGMDMAFCMWNKATNTLEYSGAKSPMYIVRNGELSRYAPSNYSIGERFNGKTPIYENHSIQLQPNDMIYLFSDGFIDQFGGEERKKFSSKRFKNLLIKVSSEEIKTQKLLIEEALSKWQNSNEQIDDILVIGIKVF